MYNISLPSRRIHFLYKLILSAIFLTFTCQNSQAQVFLEYSNNYDFASNEFLVNLDSSGLIGSNWGVLKKKFNLTQNQTSIIIETKTQAAITFNRVASYQDLNGVLTWLGNTTSSRCSNCKFQLTSQNGKMDASIIMSDSSAIRITSVGNTDYFFSEIHLNSNTSCNQDLMPDLATVVQGETQEQTNARIAASGTRYFCNGIRTYSVIIAYTPEFASSFSIWANPQARINSFLSDAIDVINETYINSDLPFRAKLVFSYMTTDSEFGNRNDDLSAFGTPQFWNIEGLEKYDEIFNYRDQFSADVSLLFTKCGGDNECQNALGKANREKNMAVVAKGQSFSRSIGILTAHEIGHMFDLEHHRSNFEWYERPFLDSKKAYGYQSDTYRSVMSQKNRPIWHTLYSDPEYSFPDGNSAGNKHARARRHIRNYPGNVIKNADYTARAINDLTISSQQTHAVFASQTITSNNYIVDSNAKSSLEAINSITLGTGTHFKLGSEVSIKIVNCGSGSSNARMAGSRIDEGEDFANNKIEILDDKLMIYPNPSSNGLFKYSEKG